MLGDLNIAEPKALIGFAGPAGDRADHPPEAAGGLPAQRVPARARHARHGRGPARAEGDASRARSASWAATPASAAPAPAPHGLSRVRRRRDQHPDSAPVRSVDPLTYLFSLEKFGIKFGLENIRALCDGARATRSAPTPRCIVAGTNGKGSVAAMVETGLRAAGLRTGLLHVAAPGPPRGALRGRRRAGRCRRRCVRRPPRRCRRPSSGCGRAGRLRAAADVLRGDDRRSAFELFRQARVDVAVLEVGLGGRFDATNVADPIAGAITTIDFDHEQHLGHTLAAHRLREGRHHQARDAGRGRRDASPRRWR